VYNKIQPTFLLVFLFIINKRCRISKLIRVVGCELRWVEGRDDESDELGDGILEAIAA